MTERKATDILDYREKQRKKDHVINWLPYLTIVAAVAIQLHIRWEVEGATSVTHSEYTIHNIAIAITGLVGAAGAWYGDRGMKVVLFLGNLFIFGYFAWQAVYLSGVVG